MKNTMTITAESLMAEEQQLRRLAAGMLASFDRRDDALQDSYLAVLRSEAPAPKNFGGYLAQVLRNSVRREGRRESQRRQLEAQYDRAGSATDTLSIVERLELRREIVDAILALKEEQRQVVFLRYFEDLMPQKIASTLDVPVATVKTRLARGLEALRQRLGANHGGEQRLHSLLLGFALIGKKTAAASLTTSLGLGAKWIAAGLLVAITTFSVHHLLTKNESDQELASLSAAELGADTNGAEVSRHLASVPNEPAPTVAAGIITENQDEEPADEEETPAGMIRVLDQDGNVVAGAAVVIEGRQLDTIRRPFRALSDARGLVDPRPALANLRRENAAEFLSCRFGFPLLDSPSLPIDLKSEAPAQELRLPATTTLKIRVLDEQGLPITGRLSLQVRGRPDGQDGQSAGRFLTPYEASFVGPEHLIPQIGLGLDLDLEVADLEGLRPPMTSSLQGPQSIDDSATITVQLSAPYPRFRGRLLDPQGQPLATTELQAAIMLPRELPASFKGRTAGTASVGDRLGATTTGLQLGRRSEVTEITTDAQGQFSFAFPFERRATVGRELIIASGVDRQGLTFGPAVRVMMEREITDRQLELGNLRLVAAPVLATGRVLDDRGEAIPNVIVTASEAPEVKEKSTKFPSLGRRQGESISWARTDSEGRFELRGAAGGDFKLSAGLAGYETATSERLTAGANLVELICDRRARLRGRVVVDDISKIWNLTISCRAPREGLGAFAATSGPRATAASGGIDADGHFDLHSLRAGLQTLEIQSNGKTLLSIESIELKPGDDLAPEHLQHLRIEGLSATPRVQLLDADGQPLAHRRAHLLEVHEGRFSTQTSGTSVTLDGDGAFWLTAAKSYENGGPIGVAGMLPAELKLQGALTILQLEAGPKLSIQFSLPGSLQKTELVAELCYQPERPSSAMMVPPPGARALCRLENAKAQFQVSHPGRYRLTLKIVGDSAGQTIVLDQDGIIEVPEKTPSLNFNISARID